MALTMSRPSTCGSRPAYIDDLFKAQSQPSLHQKSPSLRSSNSSISFASATPFDHRTVQPHPRPLSPAFEEDQTNDGISVRSLRMNLSPRAKLKSMWNRRTYPQIKETVDDDEPEEQPHQQSSFRRRPSLPKLNTSFSSVPPQKTHRRQSKPLPGPPRHEPEGLTSQPCYYFHARNCNGYVMGGGHGDACENCAQAGFFGAP